MGMSSSPAPPPPPDPMATAKAQGQMNKETAITQAALNNVNQVTPQGTLTYTPFTDENGNPRYTATTALSPDQQAIYDINQGTEKNIATIGNQQSQRIGDLLGSPLNINQAVSDKIVNLGRQRLDPQFAQAEEALRTRLINSGIREGSAAYDAAVRNFNQGKNDAYNSLYLQGNQQAESQAIAERNQPINEITALLSGSQVSNPTFQNTPQTPVAGVDYTGLVNNNYNAQLANYKTQLGQSNAAMGGLFGLGGTIGSAAIQYGLPMMLSDRRAKTDIQKVGKLDNGLNIYRYRYRGDDTPQVGVMAQEVEKVHPEAVATGPDGLKRVDYAEAVR